MNIKKIEDNITGLLLNDIVIFNNTKKHLKKGKLMLFRVKEFYIVFSLKNEKGEIKEYELPYPFNITSFDGYVKFDYMVDTFTGSNEFANFKTKVLSFEKRSKLYNSTVVLSAV
jgi:hypothetical protein